MVVWASLCRALAIRLPSPYNFLIEKAFEYFLSSRYVVFSGCVFMYIAHTPVASRKVLSATSALHESQIHYYW